MTLISKVISLYTCRTYNMKVGLKHWCIHWCMIIMVLNAVVEKTIHENSCCWYTTEVSIQFLISRVGYNDMYCQLYNVCILLIASKHYAPLCWLELQCFNLDISTLSLSLSLSLSLFSIETYYWGKDTDWTIKVYQN